MTTAEAITVTTEQAKRFARDVQAYAGEEPVSVRRVGNTFHVLSSELGVLRIWHKYNGKVGRVEYSKNLQSWVFTLTIRLGWQSSDF